MSYDGWSNKLWMVWYRKKNPGTWIRRRRLKLLGRRKKKEMYGSRLENMREPQEDMKRYISRRYEKVLFKMWFARFNRKLIAATGCELCRVWLLLQRRGKAAVKGTENFLQAEQCCLQAEAQRLQTSSEALHPGSILSEPTYVSIALSIATAYTLTSEEVELCRC